MGTRLEPDEGNRGVGSPSCLLGVLLGVPPLALLQHKGGVRPPADRRPPPSSARKFLSAGQGYAVSAKSLNDADNFTTIAEALFSCCGSRDKKKLSREDENLPDDPSKKAVRPTT